MSPDYEEAMRAPLERRRPAEKLTREALAERVANNLVHFYPEVRQLELIAEALARWMKETGKIRELQR